MYQYYEALTAANLLQLRSQMKDPGLKTPEKLTHNTAKNEVLLKDHERLPCFQIIIIVKPICDY